MYISPSTILMLILLPLVWFCGPTLYLRWVWRRWGRVRILVQHLVLLPSMAYSTSAILGAADVWLDSGLDFCHCGMGGPRECLLRRAHCYGMLGVQSLLLLGLLVPVLPLWKLFLPVSFATVWQPHERWPQTSAEEADYQDD